MRKTFFLLAMLSVACADNSETRTGPTNLVPNNNPSTPQAPLPPVTVSSVQVSTYTVALVVGHTQKVTCEAVPTRPDPSFNSACTWTSDNSFTASVSTDGTIRGIAPGFVNVVARSIADTTKRTPAIAVTVTR